MITHFLGGTKCVGAPDIRNENLPIASGAMESASRRVIHIWLKKGATYLV